MQRESTPLDYDSAVPGGRRVQMVLHRLLICETTNWTMITVKLLCGLALSFIGPWFVSAILFAVLTRLGVHMPLDFEAFFVLVSLIVFPLLMRLERRTAGEFLSDALSGETSPLAASSYGEFEMQRTRVLWTAYTEIALLGPRLLWDVIDRLRGRSRIDPDLRVAAAKLTLTLLDCGQGIEVNELLGQGWSHRELSIVANYLKRIDWIDISASRDRVWLTSETRRSLASL